MQNADLDGLGSLNGPVSPMAAIDADRVKALIRLRRFIDCSLSTLFDGLAAVHFIALSSFSKVWANVETSQNETNVSRFVEGVHQGGTRLCPAGAPGSAMVQG